MASGFEAREPIIPLISASCASQAIWLAKELVCNGLRTIEVVLRSDVAIDCLAAIAKEVPEVRLGAGTVLSSEQADQAISAGADFLVTPGLDRSTVQLCHERGIPIIPGVMTPSEVIAARHLNLRLVKFFPAESAGGAPMLKGLSAVFRDMRFMPTGGISVSNLSEYLALDAVAACGGSWLTPRSLVEKKDRDGIAALAREALKIAQLHRQF